MRWSLLLLFSLYSALPISAEPVLILPFFGQSPGANVDWISESFAHTIQEALVARGMLVLDRDERETVYRRMSIRPNAQLTHASVIKIGEALDASEVVFGTYELVPAEGTRGTLRITADVLDMKRMRRAVQLVDSGPLEDLASIQNRMAWKVLKELAPDRAPSQAEFLREQPLVRLDAMENYTRGLLAANDEQKHRYLTQAARLDERFSEPSYELGRMHWQKKDYRLAATWLARVKPNAPRYLEASFLLGLCRYYTSDFAGAQASFEVVVASVPLNEVFNNLGAAQSRRNRPEALENFSKALEGDTADPDYHFNVGVAQWKQSRFEQAAASFRAVLDRDPEDAQATLLLGLCLSRSTPTAADVSAGFERVKVNYEEGAYRQLKAALEGLKKR
ncbi:MAG TPA: tetratricopeptide repeat protein [Bryobacteraceae bacterium]|nr:tetratricopeptide repeat protein [Bryobacteraceae bacterium]